MAVLSMTIFGWRGILKSSPKGVKKALYIKRDRGSVYREVTVKRNRGRDA